MMVRLVPLAAAVLLVLATITNARILPNRSKQVKVYSYVLPAGAEEIRDDINHSFACGNRTDGFYVDIDNDCQIFHRCQDHARFSFICAERTVFSQMYQTCVHDGQLGYPCEESAQYYPDGEGYEPSASGSEAAEESPQVEEMQPEQQAAPAQELEAPQAPSKAVEVVAPSEEAAQPESSQDNVQQPSEQVETAQEMKDEPEQEQEDQHQLNADLFDPIEEEGDVPSENSAQEVMDESEPSAPSAEPSQVEQESNEVEVLDEVATQPEQQQQEQLVSSEPSPAVEAHTSQDEANVEEEPERMEMDTPETPIESEPSATPEMDNETHREPDALLNAVQMVEELEPIVHDLALETDELKPLVAEIAQDTEQVPAQQEDNEILPESHSNAATDMEAPQITSDASSPVGDSEQSALESEQQQVNELLPETELSSAAIAAADDSSETLDTVSVEADQTVPSAEPETVDVKLADSEASTPTEEQDRPLASPAIVEEKAPLRPSDSAELPELIVSTEFHLDAVTQGPPIRRRKTFLFRADAIRSRQ